MLPPGRTRVLEPRAPEPVALDRQIPGAERAAQSGDCPAGAKVVGNRQDDRDEDDPDDRGDVDRWTESSEMPRASRHLDRGPSRPPCQIYRSDVGQIQTDHADRR